VYSSLVYLATSRQSVAPQKLAAPTMAADIVLGTLIALMTEGATSPFYPFFAFSVVVAGFRAGLRQAMAVTGASVVLYLVMIVLSAPGSINVYIMRPAYLAIVGYLVGYLGQQRIELQREIQQLEATEQRHRIARDLHDGFAQALAGISLRIEACRRLLRRNHASDAADALADLTDLRASVNREYDDLRAYMSALAGVRPSQISASDPAATRYSIRVDIDGPIDFVDHVLQIAREGMSNVQRHAAAATAVVHVSKDGSNVRIAMEDDGVGSEGKRPPWSIVSRVRELGGEIQMLDGSRPGTRFLIHLPVR
ncbi:MAG: sensor histidine kinase, partial [Candidatus Binatia bacterium]